MAVFVPKFLRQLRDVLITNVQDGDGLSYDSGSGKWVNAAGGSAGLQAHLDDTSDAHDASAISISDAGNDFTATDVEGALAELQSDAESDAQALTDHIADTSDAHDASAVSVADSAGNFTGSDVESVLAEIDAAKQPNVRLATARAFRMSERGSAFACGVDDIDDVGWFQNGSSYFTSPDNVTLTDQGKPSGVTVGSKVVRFGNYVYVDAVAGGVVKVYRSIPPSAGTVSWSSALLTTAGTSTIGPAFNKSDWGSDDVLLFAEYGEPSGGPSIWRSSDGSSWDQVLGPVAAIRHFHAVAADPYNAGHIYATAGDGDSKVLYRSTDGGDNWTLLISDNDWQAVQISFSEDYVWFAGDGEEITVWVLDRDDATTPIMAASNHHSHIAVPGGTGAAGQFTDGVLTDSSTTFTSETASFSSEDVGKLLRFDANTIWQILYDSGISISSVTDAKNVVMSRTARGSTTGVSFYVDGDLFFRTAFYGRVDPDTGIYYCVANAGAGTRCGLFYLPHVGGRLELLEVFPAATPGELHIRDSKLWFHEGIHPLLARAS